MPATYDKHGSDMYIFVSMYLYTYINSSTCLYVYINIHSYIYYMFIPVDIFPCLSGVYMPATYDKHGLYKNTSGEFLQIVCC
jgi:hypothetical protein